jgi:DNA polymerase-3 subunit alpha
MLLNCHTYYSLGYGTLAIDELMDAVKQKGFTSFVLSDINNTSAILDALRLMTQKDIKVIPGIDFRNGIKQKYIGIAMNNEGFEELNRHLSFHLHNKTDIHTHAPEFNNAFVIYPFKNYDGKILRENEFIGISAKELNALPFSKAKHYKHKLVVLHPVTFTEKKQFNAHRLLRAIDQNTLLSKLPGDEQTSPDEMMPGLNELYFDFDAYPDAIKNTEHILASCKVEFEFGKLANKNKKYFSGSFANDIELLRSECEKGLSYRYPNASKKVLDRLQMELDTIAERQFASYFLINWDIIKYAQHKNYYYVGRGSGANSIVAYLLKITDVDPVDLDLYFERFINKFRNNAPDFDIDFSWTDRDDITRYIFEKHTTQHATLLGAYSTYQSNAVIRELGKVFGLPPHEIDKLQEVETESQYKDLDKVSQQIIRYGYYMHGFPSHLSIHSSGILISEKPMTAYTATFMPPKGYPTTQFSMQEAEDIGLFKFDILSQRGLGKIKDSLTIIKENKNEDIDIHNVKRFYQDETVKNLLRIGKCIGCFYIESPAMRMLLAKLQADDYLRLVAASSIIRPGVAKSGMMREYILRYRHIEKREAARKELPQLYNIMEETYGVMVYQEDVLKVAHEFAGLSLEEADHLRRGMSWKFKQRNEFHLVKKNFITNCYSKGHPPAIVEKTWKQIESFANFAFSKGHSASYAVESYQALFLKAYYPLEYMTATINNGGGFYKMELYIHEARMHGANIIAPCVNNSNIETNIKEKNIYLGFSIISSFEKNSQEELMKERNTNGAFKDLHDFIKRVPISLEQLRLLIRAGAFNFTGKNKKELLWEAHLTINPLKKREKNELFEIEQKKYRLPKLKDTWLDNAYDEIELFGFSLCSPFDLVKEKPKTDLVARKLKDHIGETVEIIGYHVTTKNTRTTKGDTMYFGTFIDTEGLWIDTVHFPPSARAYPFSGPGCYFLRGKVVEEFDHITIEVDMMKRLPNLNREDDVNPKPFSLKQKRPPCGSLSFYFLFLFAVSSAFTLASSRIF